MTSSSYWAVVDYLERIPNGYIVDQQGLIEKLKQREGQSLTEGGV